MDLTEAERAAKIKALKKVFPLTGEIMGETDWRRWRTEDGWHGLTPVAIIAKHGWLFDDSLAMPEGYPDA